MSYTLNLHTFGRSHVVATRGFSKLKLPLAGFFRLTPRELVRVKPDSFMILVAFGSRDQFTVGPHERAHVAYLQVPQSLLTILASYKFISQFRWWC